MLTSNPSGSEKLRLRFLEPVNEHGPRLSWRQMPLRSTRSILLLYHSRDGPTGGEGCRAWLFYPVIPGRWFRQVAAAGFFGEHWELLPSPSP